MTTHHNRSASRVLPTAAAAFIICGFTSAAFAVPEYVKTACKADYKKFCPDYKLETPALRACMVAIAHQLSSRCTDALERSGEKKKGH